MAVFNKVNDFVEHRNEGVHNLASDQLVIALSNTAPGSETNDPSADGNGVLANVTEIAYTNLSSRNITTTSSSQTGGTYKLVLQDLVLTASGGAVATFRYVYVYNDTPTAPADPLIGYYDRGAGNEVTLQDGENITIDFDDTNGLFQDS